MLSSRYLHLHEALGLGPMWLNRQAVVVPKTPQPVKPAALPSVAASPTIPNVRTLSAGAHHARMAAIATASKTPTTKHMPEAHDSIGTPAEQPNTENVRSSEEIIMPRLQIDVMPSEIMAVSVCPSPADGMSGQLFSGKVGILLDNMLAAIGLMPEQAHKTCWVKTVPLTGLPQTVQIQAELTQMGEELAQSQAKAVLFLGQDFEKAEYAAHMAQLCGNVPYLVIPHPARLLRQPQLKAVAWQQLKKLKALLRH